MIYCLGRSEFYDKYIAEDPHPKKQGEDKVRNYPGGSVWRTYEDAIKHISEGFKVYGVLADWEKDTRTNRDGFDWNDLLHDRLLVQVNEKGEEIGVARAIS